MQINKDLIISGTNMTLGDTAYKDIYSTTETKTNKIWIDGRPIYRKVITGNLSQAQWNHGITFDTIVSIEGVFINTNSGNTFNIPSTRPDFPDYQVGVFVNNTFITLERAVGAQRADMSFYVVLEYVK